MKLLIVDDSFTMRRMLVRALKEVGLELKEICEAGDGMEGLAKIASFTPDLVICDYSMPKLDGLKFAAGVRRKFTSAQTKILMLTAKADRLTEASAKQIGIDDFVAKPFEPEDLARRIGLLMGKPA